MSKRKQAHISSFFQPSPVKSAGKKRAPASFPIDLTSGGSDDERAHPPSKRPKTTPQPTQPTPQGPSQSVVAGPVLQKYGYVRGDTTTQATPKTPAQETRHEAFKKRLLLDDSSLLPSTSTYSVGEGNGEHESVLDPMDATQESDSDADDDRFRELQEKFANKSQKGSAKGKELAVSPKKRTKKVVEVGPSGQTYTPLELQVGGPRCIAPFAPC